LEFWAETGNRRYERSYRNKAGIMIIGARFLVREDVPLFSLVAVQSFSRGVVLSYMYGVVTPHY